MRTIDKLSLHILTAKKGLGWGSNRAISENKTKPTKPTNKKLKQKKKKKKSMTAKQKGKVGVPTLPLLDFISVSSLLIYYQKNKQTKKKKSTPGLERKAK